MGLLPDFVDFFSSYGSYHDNIVNKIIHIICIPLIVFSLLNLLLHSSLHYSSVNLPIELDPAIVFVLIISMGYVSIEFFSGIISTVFYTGQYILAKLAYEHYEASNQLDLHFKIALYLHVIAWIAQFIGHGVFEKRKPALLSNIFQTLVAPDFVIIEILFLLGYRKADFEKCKKQIASNIEAFRKQKAL